MPDLLDAFPSQRSCLLAEARNTVQLERDEADLRYQRRVWQLDLERREAELEHQGQLNLQAEWNGVLDLLRKGLLVLLIALLIVELVSGGGLEAKLLKLAHTIAEMPR